MDCKKYYTIIYIEYTYIYIYVEMFMRQFFNFVFLLCEWVLHHLYWSATQEYGCYMCREYAKVGNVCETNACENYVIFKICAS